MDRKVIVCLSERKNNNNENKQKEIIVYSLLIVVASDRQWQAVSSSFGSAEGKELKQTKKRTSRVL